MSADVCSSTALSSRHGYIRSPNYPLESAYSGRRRCACRLRASSRIIFSLLDLSTAAAHLDTAAAVVDAGGGGVDASCPSSTADLVRLASADGALARRYCGRLESDRLPETFDTRRADAVVEYLTHGRRRRARGFWLAYTSPSSHRSPSFSLFCLIANSHRRTRRNLTVESRHVGRCEFGYEFHTCIGAVLCGGIEK